MNGLMVNYQSEALGTTALSASVLHHPILIQSLHSRYSVRYATRSLLSGGLSGSIEVSILVSMSLHQSNLCWTAWNRQELLHSTLLLEVRLHCMARGKSFQGKMSSSPFCHVFYAPEPFAVFARDTYARWRMKRQEHASDPDG